MRIVKIDQDVCITCGMCEAACPEVFSVSGNPHSKVVEEYRTEGNDEGEVPTDVPCLEDAKDNCPVDAIEVK